MDVISNRFTRRASFLGIVDKEERREKTVVVEDALCRFFIRKTLRLGHLDRFSMNANEISERGHAEVWVM
jgi:hypothetical protein